MYANLGLLYIAQCRHDKIYKSKMQVKDKLLNDENWMETWIQTYTASGSHDKNTQVKLHTSYH